MMKFNFATLCIVLLSLVIGSTLVDEASAQCQPIPFDFFGTVNDPANLTVAEAEDMAAGIAYDKLDSLIAAISIAGGAICNVEIELDYCVDSGFTPNLGSVYATWRLKGKVWYQGPPVWYMMLVLTQYV